MKKVNLWEWSFIPENRRAVKMFNKYTNVRVFTNK